MQMKPTQKKTRTLKIVFWTKFWTTPRIFRPKVSVAIAAYRLPVKPTRTRAITAASDYQQR